MPGMSKNVEPNIERDRCAVGALQMGIRRLEKAFPNEKKDDGSLTEAGQDINYMRMTLDLYSNTDWGADIPFDDKE